MRVFNKILAIIRPKSSINNTLGKVHGITFPNGKKQIFEEAEMLHAILDQRVSIVDLENVIAITKPMFYVRFLIRGDSSQRISNNIFNKYSKISISSNDINSIHIFFINYFKSYLLLESEPIKSPAVPDVFKTVIRESSNICICDEKGEIWSYIDLLKPDIHESLKMKIDASTDESIYLTLVLYIIPNSAKNLTKNDKFKVSQIANLPLIEWNKIHYSRFAFLMADWLCDPNAENIGIKIQQIAREQNCVFKTTSGELYKNPKLQSIYKKVFPTLI